jgi:uncharacterized protein (TIGR00269 family)
MGQRSCKFYAECKQNAVAVIQAGNLHLCKTHFLQQIEKRIQQTIEKYHLLELRKPEKLLLALSGGKDSQVLLYILHKLYGDQIPMEGLYVQLGITHEQYSADSGKVARQTCERLGIPYHEIDIKTTYGIDIDDIHGIRQCYKRYHKTLGSHHFKGICAYCGAFKRYSINNFAVKNGFTKVATGHNLTDEATALLVNFFNAERNFMARAGPINNSNLAALVPRIKPLFYVEESEISLYAFYSGIDHTPIECGYAAQSPNPKIKRELITLAQSRTGLLTSMMRQFQKVIKPVLVDSIKTEETPDRVCSQCGLPASKKICSFCRQKAELLTHLQRCEKLRGHKKNNLGEKNEEDNSEDSDEREPLPTIEDEESEHEEIDE